MKKSLVNSFFISHENSADESRIIGEGFVSAFDSFFIEVDHQKIMDMQS